MSTPTARPRIDRPALLTIARLDELRARHLANATECQRRAEQHPIGSEESELWAARALDHGHMAWRLRSVLDNRTRRYGVDPITAEMGVFA